MSEITWVEIQGKPRLQYYAKRFPYQHREKVAILAVFFFGAICATWSVGIVGHRVNYAWCYWWNAEKPELCHATPIEVGQTSGHEGWRGDVRLVRS